MWKRTSSEAKVSALMTVKNNVLKKHAHENQYL